MGMFFGPGKRKGFSSFKVVDRSNKTRKSTVQLPSTLPLEKEQHRSVEDVVVIRVGQGFWVYGIKGLF